MSRPSKERLAKIRETASAFAALMGRSPESADPMDCCVDLLAEVDALRSELAEVTQNRNALFLSAQQLRREIERTRQEYEDILDEHDTAWSALGGRGNGDDPDVATLPQAIEASLQYERDQAELRAEQIFDEQRKQARTAIRRAWVAAAEAVEALGKASDS